MCFGSSDEPYSAYDSGHFSQWERSFNAASDIRQKEARGEITPQQAQQMLAQLGDQSWLENKVKSDAAAGMEMRELQRQGDVSLGRIGIDKAFSRFGDEYFNDYQKTYTDNYVPELDRQYKDASGKTTASLADRGMLESSVGINKFTDLKRERDTAASGIASEGLDAANKLRGNVQNAKSNLYSLNEASANPQAVNAQAIGSATSLVAPPAYSPLGQVFASTISSLGAYQQAKQNAASTPYKSPFVSSPTGYGSGSVVR